jgi:polyisoprenoid-binding protein YceI
MAAERRRPILGPVLALCLGLAAAAPLGTATRTFRIDPDRSRASIAVGKAGAFSFAAGHTHEVAIPAVSGTVTVETDAVERSTVRLEIDAASLRVTGKGDPPKDVPEVQRVMLSDKVLDVDRYPKILFQSTGVTVERRTGTTLDLNVVGTLTLRQVARPIRVPVHADLDAGTLTASGRFQVKQTDHGIKPVSVAGVVSVKDALDISFTIVARDRAGR